MTFETFQLKLTSTDHELWGTVLWASSDDSGQPLDKEHTIHDVDSDDVLRLNADYWQFCERADAVLIKHGRGDTCLEDLWATRVEHLFVLVRERHGVSFTDDWIPGSVTHKIAVELDRIARSYPQINAMADSTGRRVTCYWE